MAEMNHSLEDLLQPVSPDFPGGVDLRFAPEWKRLQEFRRADDPYDKGGWETKEVKTADWVGACAFATELLRTRSKDLRVAVVFAEAKFQTEGLPGLVEALRYIRQLAVRFWNDGLLPTPDDSDQDGGFTRRAMSLSWLDEPLATTLFTVRVTARADAGRDYTYAEYELARGVGRAKDYETGKTREQKEDFERAKKEGRCLDLFEEALRNTKRSHLEQLSADLNATAQELADLDTTLTLQFAGTELLKPLEDPDAEIERLNKVQRIVPGFSRAKAALQSLRELIDPIVEKPAAAAAAAAAAPRVAPTPMVVKPPDAMSPHFELNANGVAPADAWFSAERLVRAGNVEQGLSEMARLAMSETSGRNRFQRKLLLAEVCLQINRPRLARTILEELAEQIDKHHLDEWETTDLVGGVWSRLYRIYRAEDKTSDKAGKYFDRLCRLDPWQTLLSSED